MQEGHPIAFISKALGKKAQALSTYEKECLAVLLVVEKWRSYLQHHEFTIQTDHRSLARLSEQRLTTKMQHKAFLKLMGLQYQIRYKKGCDNMAADALSRKYTEGEEQWAITVSTPRWLEMVVESYQKDPETNQLLTGLSLHPEGRDGFQLVKGVIRFKGKIWLGNYAEAKQAVMMSLHDSGIGGHSGRAATYHRIKSLFA